MASSQAGNIELLQQGVQVGLALLLVRLDHFEHRADIVLDIEPAKNRRLLRKVPDAEARPLVHRQSGHVVPVELDAPSIGGDEPGDHVEYGGLAGAVRSEQADRFAAAQIEANPLHDLSAAEALFHVVNGEIPSGGGVLDGLVGLWPFGPPGLCLLARRAFSVHDLRVAARRADARRPCGTYPQATPFGAVLLQGGGTKRKCRTPLPQRQAPKPKSDGGLPS